MELYRVEELYKAKKLYAAVTGDRGPLHAFKQGTAGASLHNYTSQKEPHQKYIRQATTVKDSIDKKHRTRQLANAVNQRSDALVSMLPKEKQNLARIEIRDAISDNNDLSSPSFQKSFFKRYDKRNIFQKIGDSLSGRNAKQQKILESTQNLLGTNKGLIEKNESDFYDGISRPDDNARVMQEYKGKIQQQDKEIQESQEHIDSIENIQKNDEMINFWADKPDPADITPQDMELQTSDNVALRRPQSMDEPVTYGATYKKMDGLSTTETALLIQKRLEQNGFKTANSRTPERKEWAVIVHDNEREQAIEVLAPICHDDNDIQNVETGYQSINQLGVGEISPPEMAFKSSIAIEQDNLFTLEDRQKLSEKLKGVSDLPESRYESASDLTYIHECQKNGIDIANTIGKNMALPNLQEELAKLEFKSIDEISESVDLTSADKPNIVYRGHMHPLSHWNMSDRPGREGRNYAAVNINYAKSYVGQDDTGESPTRGLHSPLPHFKSANKSDEDAQFGFITAYKASEDQKFYPNFGIEDGAEPIDFNTPEVGEDGHLRYASSSQKGSSFLTDKLDMETAIDPEKNPVVDQYVVMGNKIAKIPDTPEWDAIKQASLPRKESLVMDYKIDPKTEFKSESLGLMQSHSPAPSEPAPSIEMSVNSMDDKKLKSSAQTLG